VLLSASLELAGLHRDPPPKKAEGLERGGHAGGCRHGADGYPASKHGAKGNEQPGIKEFQGFVK